MRERYGEVRGGVLIFLATGLFFLLLEVFDLASYSYLKVVNVLFVIVGVRSVLKYNLRKGQSGYIQNLLSGFLASLIGVSLSVLALVIYLGLIVPTGYYSTLSEGSILFTGAENAYQFLFGVLIEGLSSSLIISYILMQGFKNVKVYQENLRTV